MDDDETPTVDTGQSKETEEKTGDNCNNFLNNTFNANAITGLLESPSPDKSLKNASFPETATPIAIHPKGTGNTPSPPQGKNYKLLYKEVTKRLFEQATTGTQQYRELQSAYNELQNKYKEDVEARDAKILSLKKTLKNATESREKDRSDHEAMITEHTKEKDEKEKIITNLKEKLSESSKIKINGLKRITSEEDLVKLKPKRSSSKKSTTIDDCTKCQFDSCGQKDVDLVKCNICSKWVCETCNDVSAANLKKVVNKCKTVYFFCKTCNDNIGSVCNVGNTGENTNLVAALQKMLDKKVTLIESKIEKTIDKKLGEKMEAVASLNEKIEKQQEAATTEDKLSYSKIMEVPAEVRKAIQDVKNDEKVEKIEQEKRSKNIIIHGADEIGDTDEEIVDKDDGYIKDILKQLRVNEEPESITRLGKPNDSKRRVLKITMKTKEAKSKVMSNLRRLKGTEEEFGKISVTDDFTALEREKLREYSIKAKDQGEKDPTRVFKVRGDPKNGLRIISFKK